MIAFETPFRVFDVGQLVRHRRYGYRGVIARYDLSCQASQEWYQANKTQPDREQPWYHVLVDSPDRDAITYAAQTSLTADFERDPIQHPLIERFFEDLILQAVA